MAMADLNRSRVVAIAIAIVLAAHLSAVGRADDETGAPSSSEKTPLAALVEDLKSDDLEKRRDAAIAIVATVPLLAIAMTHLVSTPIVIAQLVLGTLGVRTRRRELDIRAQYRRPRH